MSFTALGDLAQSALLRRSMAQVKSRMTTLSQEVTTGLATDSSRHLGGDLGALSAIRSSLDRLAAMKTTTAALQLRTGAMQSVLETIGTGADEMAPALIGAAADEGSLNALAATAQGKLSAMIAALNTSVGGQAVFAGTAVDRTPLMAPEEMMSVLKTLTAGLGTVAEVTTAVEGWFADPTHFYRGNSQTATITVAEGETVSLGLTAMDPALRDTLRGFALAALGAEGGNVPRADLLKAAGQTLLAAQPGRADLRAGLGAAEERIADAQTRNAAESSALELAQVAMLSVDDYDSATRLTEAETQLQLIYSLTARLSALSLADYIR